jgi:hypothetical protein
MRDFGRLPWLSVGFVIGGILAGMLIGNSRPALANNDHFEDNILCTGAVAGSPSAAAHWNAASKAYHPRKYDAPIDGVWLLDSQSGKLLGTVVDRIAGKTLGWAELDLHGEFGLAPGLKGRFTMTTGSVAPGQAALYLAETTTGKLGVYTMGPRPDGATGIMFQRVDRTSFRNPVP